MPVQLQTISLVKFERWNTMYELLKKIPMRYIGFFIGGICVLGIILYFIFSGGSSRNSDYQRSIDNVERIETEQRNSVDLNQELQSITDRSTELNQQATIRIERIEEYNQGAAENLERSQQEIDRAIRALERNRTIYNRIEERNQE